MDLLDILLNVFLILLLIDATVILVVFNFVGLFLFVGFLIEIYQNGKRNKF